MKDTELDMNSLMFTLKSQSLKSRKKENNNQEKYTAGYILDRKGELKES